MLLRKVQCVFSKPFSNSAPDSRLLKNISNYERKYSEAACYVRKGVLANFGKISLRHDCSPCKLAACFQNTFSQERLWWAASNKRHCQTKNIIGNRKHFPAHVSSHWMLLGVRCHWC